MEAGRCSQTETERKHCRGRAEVWCPALKTWLCGWHANDHHLLAPGKLYCTPGQHFKPTRLNKEILFLPHP